MNRDKILVDKVKPPNFETLPHKDIDEQSETLPHYKE